VRPARDKIVDPGALERALASLPRPLVFTNGCFDILHRGHVDYLERAAGLGASLVVGLNSDGSMQRLGKSGDRPLNALGDRLAVVAALESVDLVTHFDQDTPARLIERIEPDHLVKGGDWPVAAIVGAQAVRARGGEVHALPFRFDRSTSALLARIRRGKED